jgi:hypothetical protein
MWFSRAANSNCFAAVLWRTSANGELKNGDIRHPIVFFRVEYLPSVCFR